jgi:hypothetical protein
MKYPPPVWDRYLRAFLMRFGTGVFHFSVGDRNYMAVIHQTFDDD